LPAPRKPVKTVTGMRASAISVSPLEFHSFYGGNRDG
jgi:hypothetical protein